MVPIEVVAGFLGAGKTRFIEAQLNQEHFQNRRVVVLQCEEGESQLEKKNRENIEVIPIESINRLKGDFFRQLKEKYHPEYIIIEYNGTWEIQALLKIPLPRRYKVKSIVSLVAADTFKTYLKNMSAMVIDPIIESDYVLVTQHEAQSVEQLADLKKSIKKLNHGVRCQLVDASLEEEKQLYEELFIGMQSGVEENVYHGMQGLCVILALVTLSFYIEMLRITGDMKVLGMIQKIHSVFIGMLWEMVPFILIGTLVASLLQILVSGEQLARLFEKHKVFSLPLAIGLGIIFPVCDCALVPIAAGMMKKGVSVMHTMFFMLAAMVVNPIVLLSTYYAFFNQPEVLVYRLGVGLVMALAVSGILGVCFKKSKTSKKHQPYEQASIEALPINICSSGYMGKLYFQGRLGKVEAVVRHTTLEFLYILPLAMGGALISAILQNIFKAQLMESGYGVVLSFVMMVVSSMIMSVCGTSNAFVARGLMSIFPMSHVVGFMVMGPMLDLKNLILVRGHFNKRFVGIYIGSILLVGWIMVMLCGWM